MPIQTPVQSRQSLRWINGIMAAMYFLVLGMLVYFRLGPFRRVMIRMQNDGVEVLPWFPVVFTLGIGVVGVFLAWRGAMALKRALRGRGANKLQSR